MTHLFVNKAILVNAMQGRKKQVPRVSHGNVTLLQGYDDGQVRAYWMTSISKTNASRFLAGSRESS